ncbi:MAG: TetR/AcrR family transcriptional regulator [Gemmatimonadales bacterium]
MVSPAPGQPAPAASPAKRDSEATRQRLIRAALELYTEAGFRGTTTPMLAQRAGVAEGTIYRHFTSKEHLLNEAYRGVQRWGSRLVREAEEHRGDTPSERLARVAHQLFEAAERDPAVLRMLFYTSQDPFLDERSRDAGREFRGAIQQIVAMGKSDGLVRAGPADLWSSLWLGLLEFMVQRICTREWTASHPQVALALEAAWDAIAEHGEHK